MKNHGRFGIVLSFFLQMNVPRFAFFIFLTYLQNVCRKYNCFSIKLFLLSILSFLNLQKPFFLSVKFFFSLLVFLSTGAPLIGDPELMFVEFV